LASACYMAKAGFAVTVLEKMNRLAEELLARNARL
jgi:NADPH-dependent 2,4-dienoyl-CoA reductase/sulfur reductase-like enzyme